MQRFAVRRTFGRRLRPAVDAFCVLWMVPSSSRRHFITASRSFLNSTNAASCAPETDTPAAMTPEARHAALLQDPSVLSALADPVLAAHLARMLADPAFLNPAVGDVAGRSSAKRHRDDVDDEDDGEVPATAASTSAVGAATAPPTESAATGVSPDLEPLPPLTTEEQRAQLEALRGTVRAYLDALDRPLWDDCDTLEDIHNEEKFGSPSEAPIITKSEHVVLALWALFYGTILACAGVAVIALVGGYCLGFRSLSDVMAHLRARPERERARLEAAAKASGVAVGEVVAFEFDLTRPSTFGEQAEALVALIQSLAAADEAATAEAPHAPTVAR